MSLKIKGKRCNQNPNKIYLYKYDITKINGKRREILLEVLPLKITLEQYKDKEFMKNIREQYDDDSYIILQPRIVRTRDRNKVINTERTYNKSTSYFWGNALFIQTWKDLGLHRTIQKISYEAGVPNNFLSIVFLLATQSIIDPDSKLGTFNSMSELVFDTDDITLRHIYDSLYVLDVYKDRIIQTVNKHLATMFNILDEYLSYDVTTNWIESFEKHDLDEEAVTKLKEIESMSKKDLLKYKPSTKLLAARGMSKDKKTHENQVSLGILMNSLGLPVYYDVYRGDIPELNTVQIILPKYLKIGDLKEPITFIADAGLNQATNLKYISDLGFYYIVSYPPHIKLNETQGGMLLAPSDWKPMYFSNKREPRFKILEFDFIRKIDKKKYVMPGRVIAMYSETDYTKRRIEIATKVAKTKKKLDTGQIKLSTNYAIHDIDEEEAFTYKLNIKLIRKQLKWAGYSAILTNVYHVDPMEVVRIRGILWKIEDNFRFFKTNIEVRPIYLQSDQHIRGHYCIKYLALMLQKVFELQLKQAGINLTTSEIVKVAQTRKVTPVIDPMTGIKYIDIQAHNSNIHGVNAVEENFNKIANFLNYPLVEDLIQDYSFKNNITKFLGLDPKLYDNITSTQIQQGLIKKAQSYKKLRA